MLKSSLPSLVEVAHDLAGDGARDGYRIVVGYIDECWSADAEDVVRSLEAEPASTGDPRLDALLAAAAEHISFHRSLPVPRWVDGPGRVLTAAWFPVDLPTLRVRGMVTSPASFARRGVFIDRLDLERV